MLATRSISTPLAAEQPTSPSRARNLSTPPHDLPPKAMAPPMLPQPELADPSPGLSTHTAVSAAGMLRAPSGTTSLVKLVNTMAALLETQGCIIDAMKRRAELLTRLVEVNTRGAALHAPAAAESTGSPSRNWARKPADAASPQSPSEDSPHPGGLIGDARLTPLALLRRIGDADDGHQARQLIGQSIVALSHGGAGDGALAVVALLRCGRISDAVQKLDALIFANQHGHAQACLQRLLGHVPSADAYVKRAQEILCLRLHRR